jgi:threonine dehydratase
VVTASTGNHGAAVAFGMRELGGTALIFVPTKAEPSKLERIRSLGSRVEFHGEDSGVTEAFARDYARCHSLTYVPPYNDVQVMAGQGTVGVELLRQGEPPDAVFVAVGGGGLIGGMATYLRALHPETVMVGCSPDNSKVLIESIQQGQVLDLPSLPTLSDGTAGGVEPDAITFDVCRDLIQEFATVTEAEIADAMRLMAERQHIVVEGAAGVAVASLLQQHERWRGKRVVIVICGGNVGSGVLKQVLGS